MKTVNVVAAIIKQGNTILGTQRGYGEFAGGWEFPGGKIEQGETPEEAIVREIHEELGIDIEDPSIKITEHSKNDQPSADPRQNVTFRYVIEIPKSKLGHIDFDSESRGGESQEVSGIKLLDVTQGLPDLEFAFNHRELTKEILSDTRFFPDRDETKLYDSIANAESGSWRLGGKRVLWILTKTPRGRVHVTIEDLDIDTFWSENTPEFIQRVILDELALRRALSHFEDIKRLKGPDARVKQLKTDGTEIFMKVSDVLTIIEAGSLNPAPDIVNPVDEFQIL
jgi:8-oxo-dGTP pyrophosphatase MutT (NUDIX family)